MCLLSSNKVNATNNLFLIEQLIFSFEIFFKIQSKIFPLIFEYFSCSLEMAQPQPKYQQGDVRRGINAILLGAPGSGKGTQVSIRKLPAHEQKSSVIAQLIGLKLRLNRCTSYQRARVQEIDLG